MKPILKRISTVLALGVVSLVALLIVGVRWGLTPLPKVPPGVRLEPREPATLIADVPAGTACQVYLSAAAALQEFPVSKTLEEQWEALLIGDPAAAVAEVSAAVQTRSAAVDLLRTAAGARPCLMPWVDSNIGGNDPRREFRNLARLACCAGRLAELQGSAADGLADYLAVIGFGVDSSRGANIIGSLLAGAVTGLGTRSVRFAALEGRLEAQQLRDTSAVLLEMVERWQPPGETLRYELLTLEHLCRSTVLTNSGATLVTSPRVIRRLAQAQTAELIRELEKPYWESAADKVAKRWEDAMEDTSVWSVVNRPMARLYVALLSPAGAATYAKTNRALVDLEATAVVCAVQGYVLEHGRPPEDLDALVPDWLPRVPVDRFDGKPLRYRAHAGGWTVWSVGRDKVDDQAVRHEYQFRSRDDRTDGGDLFFGSDEPARVRECHHDKRCRCR